MVAPDDEHGDPGLVQQVDLVGKEAGSLHRRLLPVVQVSRQQQSVHLFIEAEPDDRNKGSARRVADQVGQCRVAQREGAERRVKVEVRSMHETKGHRSLPTPLQALPRSRLVMAASGRCICRRLGRRC